VRLVNSRIIETINLKRSGATQTAKRRDNLMGFDVAGIIKLLSNKTKLVSPNLIPIINDFFTSAEEFALVASIRDNDGRIKGLSGDINPLDLTVMLNAMSRYNIKIKPEFVQLISVVLEPSQNGVQRVRMLKDIEVNRLLQALLYYSNPKNIDQPKSETECISIPILNSFIKELVDRFK